MSEQRANETPRINWQLSNDDFSAGSSITTEVHPSDPDIYRGLLPHQTERQIADILVDGLTEEQRVSFIEGPTESIPSRLVEQPYLIGSVVDKIKELEQSTFRQYLLALIGGLPEQQRMFAVEQLMSSNRQIDQMDAVALLKLDQRTLSISQQAQLLDAYYEIDDVTQRLQLLSDLNIENGIDKEIFTDLLIQLNSEDEEHIQQSLAVMSTWVGWSNGNLPEGHTQELIGFLNSLINDTGRDIDIRLSALGVLQGINGN
ncbi:hypothetical protein IC617_15045 [Neiella sp. HB171785]|uniref:Uncharacterized protein n=1 Tax=Neiella litorisoli TaxID=2771431 RepID=A0A8J6QM87_9GAMM|nr:hypothetical protein [Neiella litorisoli]MBD1390746.1 hypothetical protein [Neiella litorisoli]